MIILDGVYTVQNNQLRFHRVNAPEREQLEKLFNRLIHRITRRLVKDVCLPFIHPSNQVRPLGEHTRDADPLLS